MDADGAEIPGRNPAIGWLRDALLRRWPGLPEALPTLDRDLHEIGEGPPETTFVVHELRVEGEDRDLRRLVETLGRVLGTGGAAAPRLSVGATPAAQGRTWRWLDLRIDPDPDEGAGKGMEVAEPVLIPVDPEVSIRSRIARRRRSWRPPLKLRMHRFEIVIAALLGAFLIRVLVFLLKLAIVSGR